MWGKARGFCRSCERLPNEAHSDSSRRQLLRSRNDLPGLLFHETAKTLSDHQIRALARLWRRSLTSNSSLSVHVFGPPMTIVFGGSGAGTAGDGKCSFASRAQAAGASSCWPLVACNTEFLCLSGKPQSSQPAHIGDESLIARCLRFNAPSITPSCF
jgi:hypothetical protein